MAPRTVESLALRSTGNNQGLLHLLARRQKANPGIVFGDRNQAQVIAVWGVADDEFDETHYPMTPGIQGVMVPIMAVMTNLMTPI
jgi:hypothetical protein